MTSKTKKQTISFNKFFPDSDAYVTLRGTFDPKAVINKFEEDFDLDFTIQSGTGRFVNLFTWWGDNETTLKQLKAINEATAKAIKFIEDANAVRKEQKKSKPIEVAPRVTKQRK